MPLSRPDSDRSPLVAVADNVLAYYFCELNSLTSQATELALTWTFDSTNYTSDDRVDLPGLLENGDFQMAFQHTLSTYGCTSSWPGAIPLTGPLPAIMAAEWGLWIQGLDIRLDYFIQIHSGP